MHVWHRWQAGLGSIALLILGACAPTDTTDFVQGTDVPASDADASRFLRQATFGTRQEDIDFLRFIGYAAWFEDQAVTSKSLHRPYVQHFGDDAHQGHRNQRWWAVAVNGRDQLRQRMAWALSQILVISDDPDVLVNDAVGCAEYYDILVRNALGNYRQLLEEVTLSPQMGKYLSMIYNRKADPLENTRPDENYAREVLQLFSIGLMRLNPDGTPVLDGSGNPIPTYDQSVVEAFARVFTGWAYGDTNSFWDYSDSFVPMQNFVEYHDQEAKTILDGQVLPAGQSGEEDLRLALDAISAHQNVGPFLGKQLIQRLVTSNPSPAYVARVAGAWADDGTGVRGNLLAVVEAILMDPEARTGHLTSPDTFGKVSEPILRMTALWRAFHAAPVSGRWTIYEQDDDFGEEPLSAPSVFNFYSPFFAPPGELADQGLVAPELQIATHAKLTGLTNRLFYATMIDYRGSSGADQNSIVIDLGRMKPLAGDPAALIERLDVLLMGGTMSDSMRTLLVDYLADVPLDDDGTERVTEALYLITTSPEGALQR
jgi:uncharacterized protein (DUF1800 family)